jgi:hypothetical protein
MFSAQVFVAQSSFKGSNDCSKTEDKLECTCTEYESRINELKDR